MQALDRNMDSVRWIDVHHHILPARYRQELERLGVASIGGAKIPDWTAQASLEMLERGGLHAALLSISSPGAYSEDLSTAVELAKICNDELAQVAGDHLDRFGTFAVLPMPHVDASLQTLQQCSRFDGVGLIASYGNQYLGDPAFRPVFEELNRRRAVVFIHPTIGPGSLSFDIDVLPAAVEFTFDTTRAVVSLLRAGVFHTYPDIKFILAHNGGTIPFLAGRIASMLERRLPYETFAPLGVSHYLKQLYYECTTSTSDATLKCVQAFAGSGQILFGTDYPFAPEAVGARGKQDVAAFGDFSKQDRRLIASGNVARLLPRFAAIL
ncbi:MAG: amidohydrolase family protein [Pseudolabrys sp.]